MGVYDTFEVVCPVCDARFEAKLVDSVNVTRFPGLKQKLLDRTLNRARCPTCGDISIVEKPFLYSDFARKRYVAVYPRKERHFHERASDQARTAFDSFRALKLGRAQNARVVFGLEELREKVVAADNEIDDRMLELLKLYVIREHPFLMDRPRLRITLNSADREKIEVYCTFDLERDFFKAYVPRAFLGTLQGSTLEGGAPTGQHLAARRITEAAFNGRADAPWVNLWSLNPSTDALKMLSVFAERMRAGDRIDLDDAGLRRMLRTLPGGNQLPGWAKRDIQTIAEYARANNRSDVEQQVFKIRFGFRIGDDWFRNDDEDDVKTIWKMLEELPDIAVEGNTWIKAIYIDKEDDGGGSYDPSTKEISMGSDIQSGGGDFKPIMLHEVGHAVQEKLDKERLGLVKAWMENDYGWRSFNPRRSMQIDEWIELMGGYPEGTSVKVKTQVRSYIQQSVGKGDTFKAAKIDKAPAGHLWSDKSFNPRKAFEKTGSDWYLHCGNWLRYDGMRFFVNYHYAELMVVSEKTVQMVMHKMPDRYAAMSWAEFFAELFAWYYDKTSKKRRNIPRSVSAWFRKNVGVSELSADPAPRPARPRAARVRKKRRRARG